MPAKRDPIRHEARKMLRKDPNLTPKEAVARAEDETGLEVGKSPYKPTIQEPTNLALNEQGENEIRTEEKTNTEEEANKELGVDSENDGLGDIAFASDVARTEAKGLTPEDFAELEPDGVNGFTKDQVTRIKAQKEGLSVNEGEES